MNTHGSWHRSNNQADSGNSEEDTQAGIGRAIDEMPEDFEIRTFITANRAEVRDMCLTEYNEAEAMDMLRQEERQETRLLDIKNLMDSTGWTAQKAMDTLKISKPLFMWICSRPFQVLCKLKKLTLNL